MPKLGKNVTTNISLALSQADRIKSTKLRRLQKVTVSSWKPKSEFLAAKLIGVTSLKKNRVTTHRASVEHLFGAQAGRALP